jgi:hypothetical protein
MAAKRLFEQFFEHGHRKTGKEQIILFLLNFFKILIYNGKPS